MICTPIGKPVSVRSIGATVAGRPGVVASSAHTIWASRYGYDRPSISMRRDSIGE